MRMRLILFLGGLVHCLTPQLFIHDESALHSQSSISSEPMPPCVLPLDESISMAQDPPKIYVTRQLPEAALTPLRNCGALSVWASDQAVSRETLLYEVRDTVALLSMVTERIDDDLLDHAPQLRIVANMAVGYDNVDVPALTRRNIVLTNTPGVLTETTADLTFALMLGIARRIGEGERRVRTGQWPVWSPFVFLGTDIHHATLGIIGLGRIGAAVARRAHGFDMRVIYHNRGRNKEAEEQLGCTWVDMDTLLSESDFVVVLVPLGPQTHQLISDTSTQKNEADRFFGERRAGADC